MIKLRKINDEEFVLNCNLIETIEETPDTIITLTTNKKIIVKETAEEIISRVISFNRRCQINVIRHNGREV